MGRFLRTLLIGVGIGLLIAPRRGEEMRQLLMERFQGLTGSLTGNSTTSQSSSSYGTSTRSASSNPAASANQTPDSSPLKQFAETAEEHSMMYTPPTSGTFEPSFPDYTNPEQK